MYCNSAEIRELALATAESNFSGSCSEAFE